MTDKFSLVYSGFWIILLGVTPNFGCKNLKIYVHMHSKTCCLTKNNSEMKQDNYQ